MFRYSGITRQFTIWKNVFNSERAVEYEERIRNILFSPIKVTKSQWKILLPLPYSKYEFLS